MKGRASMVGVVRGVDRNEIRMIIVSDTEGELARAMRPWTTGQRSGEGVHFMAGALYHGKTRAEVLSHIRTIIGPEIEPLPQAPRVSPPDLPESPL